MPRKLWHFEGRVAYSLLEDADCAVKPLGARLFTSRSLLILLRLAEQLDLREARADELAVGGVRLEDADP
jgi:hypothetical protein